MKSIYVITMWTGGKPAKKWKSYDMPEVLSSGTGVEFSNVDTGLKVRVVGNISVEQFESGKEEIEAISGQYYNPDKDPSFRGPAEDTAEPDPGSESADGNIERLF